MYIEKQNLGFTWNIMKALNLSVLIFFLIRENARAAGFQNLKRSGRELSVQQRKHGHGELWRPADCSVFGWTSKDKEQHEEAKRVSMSKIVKSCHYPPPISWRMRGLYRMKFLILFLEIQSVIRYWTVHWMCEVVFYLLDSLLSILKIWSHWT